jgi:hypothetical protein
MLMDVKISSFRILLTYSFLTTFLQTLYNGLDGSGSNVFKGEGLFSPKHPYWTFGPNQSPNKWAQELFLGEKAAGE